MHTRCGAATQTQEQPATVVHGYSRVGSGDDEHEEHEEQTPQAHIPHQASRTAEPLTQVQNGDSASELASELCRPRDRRQYRRKVQRCLDALDKMLTDGSFCFPHKHIGLELELNLIDSALRPSMNNAALLDKLNDSSFTTELGRHNVELNLPPRPLSGESLGEMEQALQHYLSGASTAVGAVGAELALIGILPTLTSEHFRAECLTNNPRYSLLNNEIFAARGEQTLLHMDGSPLPGRTADRLRTYADSILPEAACTSAQLHLQVGPDEFASYWNAAQCLSGVQLAIGANSPFLLGKALWHETRIPLFLQATDTRPEELKAQGVRPRVWFGERWITSIFDLFEENVRYFPGLLPEIDPEDPLETLESGTAPQLNELRVHNGTVWRWNRPIYDVVDGRSQLRIENRVLPAGPTVTDMLANAAFFYGAQRALADADCPVWTQMSFRAAEENLVNGARDGMDAELYWPGMGRVPPAELALRVLIPLAYEGLRASAVPDRLACHYLSVLERRCIAARTGSSWQRDSVERLEARGLGRHAALHTMFARYVEHSAGGQPVHEWPTI